MDKITYDQYLEAKRIVDKYNDQMYDEELAKVKEQFPIGTNVMQQHSGSSGRIYDYGRQRNDVTLRIIYNYTESTYKGFILSKYAKIKTK